MFSYGQPLLLHSLLYHSHWIQSLTLDTRPTAAWMWVMALRNGLG